MDVVTDPDRNPADDGGVAPADGGDTLTTADVGLCVCGMDGTCTKVLELVNTIYIKHKHTMSGNDTHNFVAGNAIEASYGSIVMAYEEKRSVVVFESPALAGSDKITGATLSMCTESTFQTDVLVYSLPSSATTEDALFKVGGVMADFRSSSKGSINNVPLSVTNMPKNDKPRLRLQLKNTGLPSLVQFAKQTKICQGQKTPTLTIEYCTN